MMDRAMMGNSQTKAEKQQQQVAATSQQCGSTLWEISFAVSLAMLLGDSRMTSHRKGGIASAASAPETDDFCGPENRIIPQLVYRVG